MSSNDGVSLSILVARTDVSFLRRTVPHIVKSSAYPFKERALVVDTAPLSPEYASRPHVGSRQELDEICNDLVADGWIDRLHYIDYARSEVDRICSTYFNRRVRETHDFRGYPIYGSLWSLEAEPTDLVVHFDSDMLLHQAPGRSWIDEAVDVLKRRSDIVFVAPLSGPPRPDGKLFQVSTAYEFDSDGFNKFKFFTSRKYLVDRRKLRSMGLRPRWISRKRRLASLWTGVSALWSFEMMASDQLERLGLWRADLSDPRAWTLHTPDHGPEFLRRLPEIVSKVESGNFPFEQAGHYDLKLELWRESDDRAVSS
jgi:hypothetical protein